MGLEKKELMDALKVSVRELQQGVDTHCNLVASILKEPIDERNLQAILNLLPQKSSEVSLREAIQETIDVLEESRKAFKSKNLGILRKKLIRVLTENS
jgi:formylmethanofuran dehydrogenase subunit B